MTHVPADAARRKLESLALSAIGLSQAAKLAKIARSTAQRIRSGQATQITADTEAKILGIAKPYLAHGQKVNAWQMKRYIRALLDEHYTKAAIAQRAGLRLGGLYRDDQRVTVKTYLKVQKVWQAANDSLPPVQDRAFD